MPFNLTNHRQTVHRASSACDDGTGVGNTLQLQLIVAALLLHRLPVSHAFHLQHLRKLWFHSLVCAKMQETYHGFRTQYGKLTHDYTIAAGNEQASSSRAHSMPVLTKSQSIASCLYFGGKF